MVGAPPEAGSGFWGGEGGSVRRIHLATRRSVVCNRLRHESGALLTPEHAMRVAVHCEVTRVEGNWSWRVKRRSRQQNTMG